MKFTNIEAQKLFEGLFIISNSDGTIWTADNASVYSGHEPEFNGKAKDWDELECKYPHVRGFGIKKVKFENLTKTEFTREEFSSTFSGANLTSPCDLITKNIEELNKKSGKKLPA